MNIISISEFNSRSGSNWGHDNDCEFHGIIPGYVCGFNLECIKNGKIDAASCTFTNDFEEILNPDICSRDWNSLGISESLVNLNGWKATGNLVFRGYYREEWNWEEREYCYWDASDEVEELWKKYVVS